jgi:hypothetical protein
MTNKIIEAHKAYTKYNHADNIIRFLMGDESVELTDTEKKRYDACRKIFDLRMKFIQKSALLEVVKRIFNVGERQAYNLINLTEEVFGKAHKVNKEFERQFLLDVSRKNLEIAYATRKSAEITKALIAHYKVAGLEDLIPDLPDFSNIEPGQTIINIDQNIVEAVKQLLAQGRIKLTDFIKPPTHDTSNTEDAQVIS